MAGREVVSSLDMEDSEVAVACHVLNINKIIIGTNKGNVWYFKKVSEKRIMRELKITFDAPDCSDSTGNLRSYRRVSSSNNEAEVLFVKGFYFAKKLLIIAIDCYNVIKVSFIFKLLNNIVFISYTGM